jgi:hypothetical protein
MSQIAEQIATLLEQQNTLLGGMLDKEQMHTKAPANFQTATPLHGLGGVFSGQGLDRDVITAHVRPRGILSVLERMPSVDEDPRFASLTGYTATTGAEPDNACEDAPQGYQKGCNLTARFGLVRRDTQTIEMDKVMLRINRGDFKDLALRGRVLGLQGLTPSGLSEQDILNIVTAAEMVGAGVQAERALNEGAWQSTVAGNWGWPGLDAQIATGQVDADTNTACPALDSDVKDFNYNDVCDGALDIVEYMSMMHYFLDYNATSMGLDPVEWVVVMRPNLWYELSACWPCKYNTNRCTGIGGDHQVITDGRENIRERDDMRRSMTLDVNGRTLPVITDTGIFEHNNTNNANLAAGQFASSIYFVPLTITGNYPVTYLEYVDYRQSQPDISMLPNQMPEFWWTDNGLFSWAYEGNKWCYKLSLKIEPRIVLRTPQLAGKIDNVRYSPLQHLREPDPDSPYFEDGGVSVRGSGTTYAVWL